MLLWTTEVYYLQNAITLGVGRHQCWIKYICSSLENFNVPCDLQTFCMMFHKNAEQHSLQQLFFSQRIFFWNTKKTQKKQLVCWGTLIGSFFFDSKFLMLRYLHLSNATFFIWWIKTSYKFTNNYIIVTDNWIRRIVFKGH